LATCLEGRIPDRDLARRNLGYLVELAARADVSVCVEFLPWSAIPDLATAWELVEPLGPGAGIVVDAWHWQRQPGGPAPEVLASIPPERILFVQLCDAAPEPSGEVMHEALTGRLPPGQGAVDFAGLFGALDSMSARPVVAAEIFNPALLAELGVAAAAVAMHDSCVAALGDRRLEGGPRR
ncbi:MAG: sugar phosphate isomerase/epimerase family protein, partial [Actinomycetota bacterium]